MPALAAGGGVLAWRPLAPGAQVWFAQNEVDPANPEAPAAPGPAAAPPPREPAAAAPAETPLAPDAANAANGTLDAQPASDAEQAATSSAPAPADPAPGGGGLQLGGGQSGLRAEPDASESRWGLAPIAWGGTLSQEFRRLSADDQASRLASVQVANLRARTYIWQPWFAQVSGNIGLVHSNEHSSGDNAGGGANSASTVVGGGTFALFPVSRFPFVAQYDVTDSRASSSFTGSDYTSKRLSLRQDYRNLGGDIYGNLIYDRSTLSSRDFGDDTVNSITGSLTKAFRNNTFEVAGNRASNTQSNSDTHSRYNSASLRHSFRNEGTFTLDNLVSYNETDVHVAGNGLSAFDSNFRFVQANSFFTWRPLEKPLDVTGGLRFFTNRREGLDSEDESRSYNANVAANYRFNTNFSAFAGASTSHLQSTERNTTITTQTAGGTYTSDIINIGNFSYDWNAQTSVANQTGGDQGSRRNIVGSIGHALTRTWTLSETSSTSFNIGQSAAANNDTIAGTNTTLTHNLGLAWRTNPSAASTAYVGLSAADSRTHGNSPSTFQLVNLMINGDIQLSRYSTLNGNITWQYTRQEQGVNDPFLSNVVISSGRNTNAYGSMSYVHAKAFDVVGLRYSAILAVNNLQTDTRLQGNADAPREQVSKSFENRLDYRIGRLDLRLLARIAEVDGKKNALMFFKISREFGSF